MGVEQRIIDGEFVDLEGDTIPASSIRDLMIADNLDPRGIRVRNAIIEGPLDLSDVHSKRPLVLRDCRADNRIVLDRAHLSSLDLTGLGAPAVSAAWLRLDHYLLMADARLDSTDDWALDLGEASIGGHLSLTGAHLAGQKYALHAPKLRAGSHVYVSGVHATGIVRFDGARLGGDLWLAGARLHSDDDSALLGVNMQVDDNVFLHRGFRASTGSSSAAIRIRGARIGGQLVLRSGRATGPVALDVKHVRVGMDLLFPIDFLDGLVALDGLTYSGVPRDATFREWLDVLATKTSGYASQPYLQLAAAHQAAGNERDVAASGSPSRKTCCGADSSPGGGGCGTASPGRLSATATGPRRRCCGWRPP